MGLSPLILDHVHNRRNVGPLEGATHVGKAGDEGGGPYMILEFRIEDGIVQEAAYRTQPCPVSIGCASFVVQYSIGRSIASLSVVEVKDIMLLLGGVPEGKEHCAARVVEAVKSIKVRK